MSAITSRLIFDCSRPVRPARQFGLGLVEPVQPARRVDLHASYYAQGHAAGLNVAHRRDPIAPATTSPECRAAWERGARDGQRDARRRGPSDLDQAYEAGRTAGMEDGDPWSPAHYSDGERGMFIEGYSDGLGMLRARAEDHLNELREQAEFMDLCRTGTACW